MASRQQVRLESNGDYWLAAYSDSFGRRRRKSLGPKSELSKRQANALCERLAVDLALQPSRADVRTAPLLSVWLSEFLKIKVHLSAPAVRAYRLAAEKLIEHVGADVRIDRLTPVHAGEWIAALTAGELSPASIANYGRHVRCLFNEAVKQRLIVINPFGGVRTQPKRITRQWHYVDRSLFSRIIQACPNDGWKTFIALQRVGALRCGESLETTWAMVDFEKRVLTLPEEITKTGQERVVPLDPELYAILLAGSKSVTRDQVLLVSPAEVDCSSGSNQHKRFKGILKRIGIAPWEDLFQTLRRNAVQDLRHLLRDPWAVTTIAGHSEEVERKYYLGRVRQSDLDRVTGVVSDDGLRQVIDRWPTLSDQTKVAIARLMDPTVSA